MNKLDLSIIKDSLKALKLSLTEWMALVLVLAASGALAFFYLNSTQPLQSQLDDLKRRESQLRKQLKDTDEKKRLFDEQRNNSEKIISSLSDFESHLKDRKQGIPAIIDEVNQLARENKVKAGDISFRTDAPEPLPGVASPGTAPSPSATPKKIGEKLLNVYEGLGIDTTVEGDYRDIRRFISAFERSRNFVIINSITLQSIDEKRSKFKANAGFAPPPGQLGQPRPGVQRPGLGDPGEGTDDGGGAGKIIVSLKIEMETHFTRNDQSVPPVKAIPTSAPATK